MTRRTLQDRYQLDDEECAQDKADRSRQCPDCGCFGGGHITLCPSAPGEPEQEEE